MKKLIILSVLAIILAIGILTMKKTVVDQTYNNQVAEILRRISKLEAQMNGMPIGNAKIKTLTWDKAQGGTATLGGAANVDGILSVNDALNVEKVRLDKDGMLINDGSLTIKNEDDVLILDASGLISTANFYSDSVVDVTSRSYSNSAAYEDISNTSVTTINFKRDTKVLVMYTLNVVEFPINGTSAFAGKVTLKIDSTDQLNNNFELQLTAISPYADAPPWGGPLTASGIITLATGTHTLKLRAQTINTNSQLNIETSSLIYIVLGS
jgi:Tfp pilus assembly protein FimT